MNEEFEKWAKETYGNNVIDDTPRYKSLPYLTDLKMASNAGATAMREKCAEAAMSYKNDSSENDDDANKHDRCHGRDFIRLWKEGKAKLTIATEAFERIGEENGIRQ
jgi:hypothetical protein